MPQLKSSRGTQAGTTASLSCNSPGSKLISLGGDRENIVNKIYRSRSINVLKLWGRILARLTSTLNNGVLWSIIASDDFKKTDTTKQDVPEAIDELISNTHAHLTAVSQYRLT